MSERQLAERYPFFKFFDVDGNGEVTSEEWINAFFQFYDVNRDYRMDLADMRYFFKVNGEMICEHLYAGEQEVAATLKEEREEYTGGILRPLWKIFNWLDSDKNRAIEPADVRISYRKMDTNQNGQIDRSELLTKEMTHALYQLCLQSAIIDHSGWI
jgi:Ca2+-binding EF-hand superfamily protein